MRRPVERVGKTRVSREETVKCTSKAAGIRVAACSERLSEITTGKSYLQPGWQQPAKAWFIGDNRRNQEDLGLTHEVVVAMKGK
jgi:hypothetical protein